MNMTYKEEIGYSLSPVVDYVRGTDDLYLCSPIASEAGHYCVMLEQTGMLDPGSGIGEAFLGALMLFSFLHGFVLMFLHS